jgi:uncharacterized protein YprB with RNaseH-like and TPR domain
MNLIFDIETNGLYNDVTCIHCIGIYDLDTEETLVFNDTGNAQPITKGVQLLEDASAIVGHNIIGYDLPVIKKLYPWFAPNGLTVDTLILSRLYFANRLDLDNQDKRKLKQMPLQLYGRHSLESYGYRLGEYKGSFSKSTDWKNWSEEMQDYMIQDVKVTTKLWTHFQPYLTGSH